MKAIIGDVERNFLSSFLPIPLLMIGGISHSALAHAQLFLPIITVEGKSSEEPSVPPPPPPPPVEIAESISDEIVITGENYGKARVEAETEFDEEAIAGHGADNIQMLLQKLAPWIDPHGEEPIILINGEPAGFDQSILGYPAEALRRLEVLKPEAATEYGQPAGKRVVNLVLKRNFSSLNGDLGGDWATAGGKAGQRLSATRTAISGRMRWNATARLSRDEILWKSHRNMQRSDEIFDRSGLIIGLDGEEIDPMLSAILGEPIYSAAFPAGSGMSLADFAARGMDRDEIDPARYESLNPKRNSASMNIGITRPIGSFNLSFNINANMSENESFRGPAMARLIWRDDHPDTPFSQDVRIIRPVGDLHILQSSGNSKSLGASINLNGKIAGWQSNFGLNINQSWNDNRTENTVLQAELQAALDEGGIDPMAQIGSDWIDRARSSGKNSNLSARISLQRPILTLPAGDIGLTIGGNTSFGSSQSKRWLRDEAAIQASTKRRQSSGQMSLNIPVNRDKAGLIPLPVNFSIDLSASANQSSGGKLQRNWSVGGNLEPWQGLQLRGSFDQSDMAPAFEQLDGNAEEIIQRLFDYQLQEMVDVIWQTGGNPDLRRGKQQGLSLNAMVRPFAHNGISINVGFRRSESLHGIMALPELTPAVEQAFPNRIFRDADGRLVRIDARSVNVESDSQTSLNSGLTVRWPMESDPNRSDAAWQLQASINHRMRLSAQRRIAEGLPVINLLSGESGQSRHSLSGQITGSRKGLGMTLSSNWSSKGRLRGDGVNQGGLIFTPPVMLNLSSHMEPDRLWPSLKDHKIWKGLQISFDIQNLGRSYRKVMRADGIVPLGYGRDDVDPVGRTIRLQLRKKF